MKKDLKNVKEKKKAALRAEDIKLYRLMVEFVLAVIMVFTLISLAKANQIFMALNVMPAVCVVTCVLFAAAAVYFIIKKRIGADESDNIITSAGIFGNAAVLFFSAAHYYLFSDLEQLALSVVIISLLYFVYSIYGGSFYVYSLATAAGFLALSISMIDNSAIVPFASLLILVFAALSMIIPVDSIVYAVVGGIKGKLGAKVAVSLVISSLIILAAAVLNIFYAPAVIYATFALLACYLVTTVVYTVKIM